MKTLMMLAAAVLAAQAAHASAVSGGQLRAARGDEQAPLLQNEQRVQVAGDAAVQYRDRHGLVVSLEVMPVKCVKEQAAAEAELKHCKVTPQEAAALASNVAATRLSNVSDAQLPGALVPEAVGNAPSDPAELGDMRKKKVARIAYIGAARRAAQEAAQAAGNGSRAAAAAVTRLEQELLNEKMRCKAFKDLFKDEIKDSIIVCKDTMDPADVEP
jgi:hypothetical protein